MLKNNGFHNRHSPIYRLIAALSLDFTSGRLDPRITFSRTTNATLTNSAGLVANAPMNLLTFSEQFDNAAWSKTNATVAANTTEAPNGTLTADTMTATAANGTLRNDPAKSGEITNSIYVKRKTGTGGVQILDATGTYRTITVTNEWTRVSYTATAASASLFGIRLSVSGDEIYIWGAQSENSSTATAYNPTTVKNLLGFTEHFDNAAWTKSNAFVQTNLLLQSEAFDSTSWGKTGVTVDANIITAPNGTTTADKLVEVSGANTPRVSQSTITTSGVSYTFSFYLKAAERSQMRLVMQGSANLSAYFDAATGVVLPGAGVTASMSLVGDGWYRCSLAYAATDVSTSAYIATAENGAVITSGDPTKGIFIWGAQLVQGTTPGDYKATYAAAAAVGYSDIYGQPFAQKLVENTANDNHGVISSSVTVSLASHTFSVFAKKGERSWLAIALRNGPEGLGGSYTFFDLENGAIGNVRSGYTASISDVGNGFYRCSITGTTTATSVTIFTLAATGNGTTVYTGDGTSGIYIFGAQLSDSASVDPYVYQPVAAPSSVAYYGPRFDYDPVTLAPKGLLIEEQRTNLITYSEQFDNAAWVKSETTVTPSTAVAPDGSLTADKAVPTTSSSSHSMYLAVAVTAGITYTGTYYVKAAGLNFLQLTGGAAGFGTSQYANFDLQNGVLGTVTGGTATITSAGNGWYRCSFTVACVTPSSVGVIPIFVTSATAPRAEVFAGDGTSGLFLWGAQLEAGAFATSYIPTVASQVTRAADSASMIGNNFARWYNQTEGTVFAQYSVNGLNPGASNAAYGISDNTTANFIAGRTLSSVATNFQVRTGGADQVALNSTSVAAGAVAKSAGAYALNNFAFTANAGTAQTDTAGTLPVVTQMQIGGLTSSVNPLNGTISRIAYYNRRLANTELQAITS